MTMDSIKSEIGSSEEAEQAEARAVVTEGIASWCADVAPGAIRN
jgi:hypothetical protein